LRSCVRPLSTQHRDRWPIWDPRYRPKQICGFESRCNRQLLWIVGSTDRHLIWPFHLGANAWFWRSPADAGHTASPSFLAAVRRRARPRHRRGIDRHVRPSTASSPRRRPPPPAARDAATMSPPVRRPVGEPLGSPPCPARRHGPRASPNPGTPEVSDWEEGAASCWRGAPGAASHSRQRRWSMAPCASSWVGNFSSKIRSYRPPRMTTLKCGPNGPPESGTILYVFRIRLRRCGPSQPRRPRSASLGRQLWLIHRFGG
jgi:hypothetical protein